MTEEKNRQPVRTPTMPRGPYGWIRATDQLPESGQEVYYFGPQLGIHIGKFDPSIQTRCFYDGPDGEPVYEDMSKDVVAMLNHNKFINNDWGVVDTDDAPWWMPYNAERAKSWCPLPPDYYVVESEDDDEPL